MQRKINSKALRYKIKGVEKNEGVKGSCKQSHAGFRNKVAILAVSFLLSPFVHSPASKVTLAHPSGPFTISPFTIASKGYHA